MTHLVTNTDKIRERSEKIAELTVELSTGTVDAERREEILHDIRIHQHFIAVYQSENKLK